MFRFRHLWVFLVLTLLFACGGGSERLIAQFFSAAEAGDEATLYAISRVEFPGVVESWEILETGQELTGPFQLPELRRKVSEAKRELDFFQQKEANFLNDNEESYQEYNALIAEESEKEFSGALAEFQQKYEELLGEGEKFAKAFEEANQEMEKEKSAASISMMGGTVTDKFDGEVTAREVLARVTTQEAGEKTYVFSLRKYNLVNTQTTARARSRWIIADIQERGA